MIVDRVLEYTIDGIHQYLQIGDLEPGKVAILVEPRYEDQDPHTREYVLSEDEPWTIGIHVRPVEQLSGADSRYNTDITVEFEDVATDVFCSLTKSKPSWRALRTSSMQPSFSTLILTIYDTPATTWEEIHDRESIEALVEGRIIESMSCNRLRLDTVLV